MEEKEGSMSFWEFGSCPTKLAKPIMEIPLAACTFNKTSVLGRHLLYIQREFILIVLQVG